MPLKLDNVDAAILKVLTEDGRCSYRRVARQVGVSTPTVKSRVKRLMDAGVIRKFAPILDAEKVGGNISTLIQLKVELPKLSAVVSSLAQLEEVRSIFVTTGEANLVLRAVIQSNKGLQDFLEANIAKLDGVSVVSSQVITRTVKDEQGVAFMEEMFVSLACDYCGQEISGKPFVLNVGEGRRFFCCRTCLSSYKEKYRSRIASLKYQGGDVT